MKKTLTALCLAFVMALCTLLPSPLPAAEVNAAGTTFIVHYGGRADDNYNGWNMWIWEEGHDGTSVQFTEEDGFGKIAIYQCKTDAARIGFIVRLNEWEAKDVTEDRYADITGDVVEIWVTSEQAAFSTTAPEGYSSYNYAAVEEERLNLYNEEGALKLNVHYFDNDGTYDAEAVSAYAWLGKESGGKYPLHSTDEFGGLFQVGFMAEGYSTAGVKIYQNGVADCNRTIDLSKAVDNVLDVYIVEGNPTVWYSAEEVSYQPIIVKAAFASTTSKQILFTLSKAVDTADANLVNSFKVTDQDGNEQALSKIWSAAPGEEFSATLILKEALDLTKTYTIHLDGYQSAEVSMDDVIGSTYYDEAFAYDGELGALYSKEKTDFRVWAPTADAVVLNLYSAGDGDNLIESIPMTADVKGTWVASKAGDLHGTYYTYSVTVDGDTQEAVDLYAKSAGVNGNRGMILDMATTNPEGFENDVRPEFVNPTDAIIWELHVRDLSSDPSSGIQNTGKFLGLTETGTKNSDGLSTGLDHMKELGITHVQILPMYDYATVDESKTDSNEFNWGYDPKNYNVPEGSYSSDPYHGEVRVKELKTMIQTLHENDIRVVMDVVYNHTYSATGSNFQKIVPNYYYRMKNGGFSNASGCGNEVASERAMARKYIVESVVYWATEYHIDGFRFDLMGCLDKETMLAVREALDKVDPSIIIYGEGWTSGDSTLIANDRALKASTYKLPGIAAFSDDIRDGLKGNVFNDLDKGYINGNIKLIESAKIGIVGATDHPQTDYRTHDKAVRWWAGAPTQAINYLSCHDNLSLWDKLAISNASDSEADRIRMNKLGAAMVFTSQGIPFMQAGEEMLRSKPSATDAGGFDHNSYKSPDSTNSIKWDNKGNVIDVTEYYKGLIALRKAHGAFRLTTTEEVQNSLTFTEDAPEGVIAYSLLGSPNGEIAEKIYVIFNPNGEDVTVTLPEGTWDILVNGDKAGTESLGQVEGSVDVARISAMVLTSGVSEAGAAVAATGTTIWVWVVLGVVIVAVAAAIIWFLARKKSLK